MSAHPACAALLEVRGLHGGYVGAPVLFDVNLQVGAAEIVGLVGRNGMGKTTLVRTIVGLLRPSSGELHFGGRSLAGLPAHRVARLGIAVVPEGRQVFPNLSVEEHLSAFQRPRRRARRPGLWSGCLPSSRGWPSDAGTSATGCQAASSRCSPSAAR